MDFNYEFLYKAFLEYHKRAEEIDPTLKGYHGHVPFFPSISKKLPPPLEMSLDQFYGYCEILMKSSGNEFQELVGKLLKGFDAVYSDAQKEAYEFVTKLQKTPGDKEFTDEELRSANEIIDRHKGDLEEILGDMGS